MTNLCKSHEGNNLKGWLPRNISQAKEHNIIGFFLYLLPFEMGLFW